MPNAPAVEKTVRRAQIQTLEGSAMSILSKYGIEKIAYAVKFSRVDSRVTESMRAFEGKTYRERRSRKENHGHDGDLGTTVSH